jgi:hypothetical protein
MIKYKNFQFGWVIVIMFLLVMVWMTLAYIHQWGNNPFDTAGYIFFIVLFGGILLGFYGITVIVTDKQILIKLGIGIYTKRIDFSSIQSVNIIKYPSYYGYGIRMIPNGILYNVSGNHAIEIKIRNKKNVIQIGTNDWDNLKMILDENIKKPFPPSSPA